MTTTLTIGANDDLDTIARRLNRCRPHGPNRQLRRRVRAAWAPHRSKRGCSCSTSPTTPPSAVVAKVIEADGGLEVLVNNAGIAGR
jgi:hypothetical protein